MKDIEIKSIIEDLSDSKSAKRRSAAKKVGKLGLIEAGDSLFSAWKKEQQDQRTWETQGEMINALGKLGYKKAQDEIYRICKENVEHDMVTIMSARAYVRLTRNSIEDSEPVLDLLSFAKFSVATGVFDALGFDRMVFDEDEISSILKYAIEFSYEKGFGDPRRGLIVAAAGWRGSEVSKFLESCLSSSYKVISEAAEKSLRGEYCKGFKE